ncbi:MAG: CoA-binding protein [Bdellovibrionales bacterium]|nr:CoA-binding protein [Bdellovibrionales bacterium]
MTDAELKAALLKYRKMTVIGFSRDPSKAAYQIPTYLKDAGYEIYGVHPSASEIDGTPCADSLKAVPLEFRKFVDVFRPSNEVSAIVDECLKTGGVEVLFFQLGIQDSSAEARARAGGIQVVSNRCLMVEHQRLIGTKA